MARRTHQKRMTPQEREQYEQAEAKTKLLKQAKRSLAKGLLMHDKMDSLDAIRILMGGDHRAPLDRAEPGFPSVLFPNTPEWATPIKTTTTGRRLTLARWITSPENP